MRIDVRRTTSSVASALVLLGVASCDVPPDVQPEGDNQAAAPLVVCAPAAKCVYEAIGKAYELYSKARGFLSSAPDLAALIEGAQTQIISEMHSLRRDELGAEFRAVVGDYGEIARNPHHPSTPHRLNEWMRDSLHLFSQLETVISHAQVGVEGDVLANAWTLAPAFNAVGALRVSVMNGIDELNFPALDQQSIAEILRVLHATNYRLVGALVGESDTYGRVEPFWGSVFWRSSKFGAQYKSCSERPICPRWPSPSPTLISCSANAGCTSDCVTDGRPPREKTSSCYHETTSATKWAFIADPVVNAVRFSLARAAQNYSFRIWDANWGWVTIIEA